MWLILPGLSNSGDVCAQAVRVRQRTDKVQVSGAERSHGTVSTTAEDQILADGQRRGHTSLRERERNGEIDLNNSEIPVKQVITGPTQNVFIFFKYLNVLLLRLHFFALIVGEEKNLQK